MEECARSMRQRSNYAAKKDAQINLSKEECAVCIKHGAKVKLCSSIGCANKVFIGGVCKRHGAKTKRCSRDGRTNQTKI